MKSYLGPFILLLTILLRVEFFALDGASTYDTNAYYVADTEWVHEDNIPVVYKFEFFKKLFSQATTSIHSTLPGNNTLYNYLQALCYPGKLQLNDGFIFVTVCPYRSHIPHQGSDEEDPALYLG